ncbi:hypothetical protein CEXT_535761 [Caerostris extrusa]|uniref:Uncharacterized protein n=1 Tax=Caerostris extrusa TaxID=172846 RepID=A0AAV4VZZ5_CAEEX|nr:hypothetical protein CEXT_535761 [Caerostris extrusa]
MSPKRVVKVVGRHVSQENCRKKPTVISNPSRNDNEHEFDGICRWSTDQRDSGPRVLEDPSITKWDGGR